MIDKMKQASAAHEKLMLNLAVFHLLFPVAALSSGYVFELLSLSLLGSILMMSWIFWQSRHVSLTDDWVMHHWQLAWKRCRLLLISYAVAAVIMLIGYFLGSMQSDHNMSTIMLVVFSRIAAVPVVLMVLVLFVMETTALSQARQQMDIN